MSWRCMAWRCYRKVAWQHLGLHELSDEDSLQKHCFACFLGKCFSDPVASWSYSCFSKGRGRSEFNTVIFHSNARQAPGAFWDGVGSRWSRASNPARSSRQSVFSISKSHQNPIMFTRLVWTLAFVHPPLGPQVRCFRIEEIILYYIILYYIILYYVIVCYCIILYYIYIYIHIRAAVCVCGCWYLSLTLTMARFTFLPLRRSRSVVWYLPSAQDRDEFNRLLAWHWGKPRDFP